MSACACVSEKYKKKIQIPNSILTFHALTFGNGASMNFTVPSGKVELVLPALVDAFESSVEVFALSVLDEFALLEVLLSPDIIAFPKNKRGNKNTQTRN